MIDGNVNRNAPGAPTAGPARAYPYAEPGPTEGLDDGWDRPDWQAEAAEWIRTNQTLATALGFAVGVFMGVMMRD